MPPSSVVIVDDAISPTLERSGRCGAGRRVHADFGTTWNGAPTGIPYVLRRNGSGFFISGAPDPRWSDDNLATMGRLTGADFEMVKMGAIVTP